ncbi:MAG: trypsin-like peptidase domain-containing protein [Pirellulaceae bacterium]
MRPGFIAIASFVLAASTVCAQVPDAFLLERTPATDKVYLEALKGTLFVSCTKKTGEMTENRLRSGFLIDKDNRLAVTQYSALAGEGFTVTVLAPLFIGGVLETRSTPYQEMLNKGKGLPATIVAVLPKSDLAVIQLDVVPEDARPLRLAKAPGKAGQKVLVLCAAFSTKEMWTYTPGIVAGVAPRKWHEEGLGPPGGPGFDFDCRVMLTEHFLVQAQMGGPVVNERGEVVAVNLGGSVEGKTLNVDVSEIRTLLASKEVTAITKGKEAVAVDKPEKTAKPTPATVEDKAKAKAETAAASKLKLAKSLAKANKRDAARQRCEDIIKAYPDTTAAEEAKALLEELDK